jgi:hypothetical protein
MNRIQQAYVIICLAPQSEDGTRSVCIVRRGAFEVRLIEVRRPFDVRSCWLELYRHDTGVSLDSCSCQDLDELESASDYLTGCATELYGFASTGAPGRFLH